MERMAERDKQRRGVCRFATRVICNWTFGWDQYANRTSINASFASFTMTLSFPNAYVLMYSILQNAKSTNQLKTNVARSRGEQ